MRRAYDWYASKNLARAEELETEFLQAIDAIIEEGETFPFHEATARRILLPKYPYGVVFEVIGETVFVIAVMHLKREPGYWKK